MEKHQCELCGNTGNNGAQWLVQAKSRVARVHKPCGEKLVAAAPAEENARLLPSPELKREWAEKRAQREAKDFWSANKRNLLKIKEDLEKAGQAPSP